MADEQDDSQKTEEPTQKRLDDARRKGQTVSSREVNHWFMIFAGALILMSFAPDALKDLVNGLAFFIGSAHALDTNRDGLASAMLRALGSGALALAIPLLMLVLAAIAGGLIQGGFTVSAERITPKLEKISPLSGLKRQFSAKAIAEFVKGLLKITIVGAISVMLMLPVMDSVDHFAGLPIPQLLDETHGLSLRLMTGVLSVMAVIAALDYLFQRFEFMKQMRMSKQELKDEFKQTEGDPMIKSRLRQIRLERSRKRMMAQVPKADVVITNPTHYAVAMKYNPAETNAPVVLAKGADAIALKIREVAREHDIPIVENPPLARALHSSVEIDQEIPPEHYKAVAEVITYVFKLKKKTMPN